jgi:hypothetical protein
MSGRVGAPGDETLVGLEYPTKPARAGVLNYQELWQFRM